jgi:hypothetical protein
MPHSIRDLTRGNNTTGGRMAGERYFNITLENDTWAQSC